MGKNNGLHQVTNLLDRCSREQKERFLSYLIGRPGSILVGLSADDSVCFTCGPLWDENFKPIAPTNSRIGLQQALHSSIIPREFESSYKEYKKLSDPQNQIHFDGQWCFFQLTENSQQSKAEPTLLAVSIASDHVQPDELSLKLQGAYKLLDDQMRALNASAIVAITDAKGVINYVNDTFCRISGYDKHELIGNTHSMLNSGYHDALFFQDLWRKIAGGQIWKGEICNRRKSGDLYWVETTIVPFLDEKTGKPVRYVSIRNDITAQKKALASLEQERMRSWHMEKMVSLGEMAAGIAHELGNPAASISAWLDVLESKLESNISQEEIDKFRSLIPKVRSDVGRIKKMIQGMLVYARDGSLDELSPERVNHLISLAQDYCAYRLNKLHVNLSYNNDHPYLEVVCRLSEMVQVMVNLILNACDALSLLPIGERWVNISVRSTIDSVMIIIADGGKGIEKDLREKIWDPFFTTKKVGAGTGLGLSLSKSIVERYGGSIEINSLSRHTEFIITLPKQLDFGR